MESPEGTRAALRRNYDGILQRFQRRLLGPEGQAIPATVMISNINTAIKDIFGWNIINKVALFKGNLQDPNRIREESLKIQQLYNMKYEEMREELQKSIILQFEPMYDLYKAVWEEKMLMPMTPPKTSQAPRAALATPPKTPRKPRANSAPLPKTSRATRRASASFGGK
jgi:hypothetical protein